jgi:hypothetical protein
VDSELTDLLKKGSASIFQKIESSQKYFGFRQVSKARKTIESAKALHKKKRALESVDQSWVMYTDGKGMGSILGREPDNEYDALNILWKLEALCALPFAHFKTLAHGDKGPDLIVHFQEDEDSEPERYTVVEAERFFYNYEPHGHNPSQYPRVICWDIGRKTKLKVQDTKKRYKKVATAPEGVTVHIFCLRHMPNIELVSKVRAEELKLL